MYLHVGLDSLQLLLILCPCRVSIGQTCSHACNDIAIGNYAHYHHKGGVHTLKESGEKTHMIALVVILGGERVLQHLKVCVCMYVSIAHCGCGSRSPIQGNHILVGNAVVTYSHKGNIMYVKSEICICGFVGLIVYELNETPLQGVIQNFLLGRGTF